ncbi:predicted protein [Nematostella vectensis]|uniref:Uncharacterized protein n=1 Tax=Nematostella vectensis TaxID=45351 RepID=A7S5E9_NEMVE|nr:predicted protein [Nematostella vectensis]|eukprot:XP_001633174.1 predicted protein [Nematostella vectensis]
MEGRHLILALLLVIFASISSEAKKVERHPRPVKKRNEIFHLAQRPYFAPNFGAQSILRPFLPQPPQRSQQTWTLTPGYGPQAFYPPLPRPQPMSPQPRWYTPVPSTPFPFRPANPAIPTSPVNYQHKQNDVETHAKPLPTVPMNYLAQPQPRPLVPYSPPPIPVVYMPNHLGLVPQLVQPASQPSSPKNTMNRFLRTQSTPGFQQNVYPQPQTLIPQALAPVSSQTRMYTGIPAFQVGGSFLPYDDPFKHDESPDAKSCLDYLRRGQTVNGAYDILDDGGKLYPVWCDFTGTEPFSATPTFAWTLVMSHSLMNRNNSAFCKTSLNVNEPVQEDTPNWDAYRLSLDRMDAIASHSTHWRATAGFPRYGGMRDYRDYMRGNFEQFDVMEYDGAGECKPVEYINIRGYPVVQTEAAFWQRDRKWGLHVDTGHFRCPYQPPWSIISENNFGFYCEGEGAMNRNFRGTEDLGATTQWWFGGHL